MLLTAFLILTAAVLLGAWYAYRTAFYSPLSHRAQIEDPMEGDQYVDVSENIFRISHIMERIPYREITIRSRDGLKLYGRYYHVRDGAPLEILFHGYRSHPYRDCSGGHALSRKMGFNALVVDQRAHGKSEGTTICFGIKERYDALEWIEYANHHLCGSSPIILSGLSMGAATVLMTTSLTLPDNVCCIIADSPFSAPSSIIEKVCADRHMSVSLCRPFLYLGAALYGRLNLKEMSAMEAVRSAKIPILLIHGEEDHYVPCEMSLHIAAHCASRVEVVTFPGAGHGLCYMIDPKRYEKIMYDFLRTIPQLKDTIAPTFLKQLFED